MSISEKDLLFMESVATYFRSTRTTQESDGSIRDTAIKFNINRNKVRKILITTGEIESPFTEKAVCMREQGMNIKEIARTLGVSVATVSTALPYENKIDNSLDPTTHASDVRGYRAYERDQRKRQERRSLDKDKFLEEHNRGTNTVPANTVKEWQDDIKMSYTEAYHRPRRDTWDVIDEIKESLKEELIEVASEEFDEVHAIMDSMKQDQEANEQELKKLESKKKLTRAEKIRKESLKVNTGRFPGALSDRNSGELERIAGKRLPPEPREIIRLHLEICDEHPNDDDMEVLNKFGKLKYSNCISRDIIVPKDMPLYALHYAIQRAFGWENSHRHSFKLPNVVFDAVTNINVSMWSCLVGVLFRSPMMSDEDEFWADDYTGGSFKNWLRKKYTGPYLSQCYGEGIISCQENMMKLDMNRDYYVVYAKGFNPETQECDENEHIARVSPVYDSKGNRREVPSPWYDNEEASRVEIMKLEDVPSRGVLHLFEKNPMSLLERLPISSVLAASHMGLVENGSEEERAYIDEQISKNGKEVFKPLEIFVYKIVREQIDSPQVQPIPSPVTETLFYCYDYITKWKIKITASENCQDLVESGRVTQSELDRANVKCREAYRPVIIARDGEMLLDDVGGIHGFAKFLRTINLDLEDMGPEEQRKAKREKKKAEEWAKSRGWHRDNPTNFNFL